MTVKNPCVTYKFFVPDPRTKQGRDQWENFDTVAEQLRRARRWHHTLVNERQTLKEAERAEMLKDKGYADAVEAYRLAREAVSTCLKDIKARRSKKGFAKFMGEEVEDGNLAEEAGLPDLRAAEKKARLTMKAESTRWWKEYDEKWSHVKGTDLGDTQQQRSDAGDPISKARQKEHESVLVGMSGLNASTYNKVMERFKTAEADAFYQVPRRRRFDDPVCLSVQGPPATKVRPEAGWTYSMITTPNTTAWVETPDGADLTCAVRAKLHLRVGRTSKDPINGDPPEKLMATIPVLLHRPLPQNGLVKFVYLHCEGSGKDTRWFVLLQIALPDHVRPDHLPRGVVGIDVGWCRTPDGGYRVATAATPDGVVVDELRLPDTLVGVANENADAMPKLSEGASLLEKMHHIQSVRDMLFDVAKAKVAAEVKTQPAFLEKLQEMSTSAHPREAQSATYWSGKFADGKTDITRWRSKDRLRSMIRECRSALSEELQAELFGMGRESWYHKDRHLRQMEEGVRRKFYDRRKKAYEAWALSLAERFDVVKIEKNVLKVFSKAPAAENGPSEHGSAARYQKNAVAISELMGCVKSTVARLGGQVMEVTAAYTSQTCSVCGCVDAENRKGRDFVCVQCRYTADADANGAVNISRRDPLVREEEPKKKKSTARRRPKKEKVEEVSIPVDTVSEAA